MMQIDVDGKLDIPVEAFIGTSTVVLGQTGSGKTNTVALLIEGILPCYAATIIDPEGEYYTLKEKFEIIVAGLSEHVDVEISIDNAGRFAEFVFEHNLSVVLDVSEYIIADQTAFLFSYLSKLYELGIKARRPHQIILEEAQEFAPQDKNTDLKELLIRIAKRGRKRGLALISASQRTAQVDKDIVTQARIMILHQVSFGSDINVYKDIIDQTPKEARRIISELKRGQAIVRYENQLYNVQVRVRETFHAGATPTLGGVSMPELRTINAELLTELQAFAAEKPVDDLEGYRQRIQELEGIIEQMQMQAEHALLVDEKMAADEAHERLVRQLEGDIQRLQSELGDAQAELDELKTAPLPVFTVSPERAEAVRAAIQANHAVSPYAAPMTRLVPLDERTPLAKQRDVNRQRRNFDSLLHDVRAMKPMHREIISFLITRDDREFTAYELAKNLGVMEVSIKSNPPLTAMSLGIIKRLGQIGGYRYKSSVQDLFQRYGDLDENELFAQLQRAARR